MQTLTAWSIILMTMTLVAGIYGMNFVFMPELEWRVGYFAALADQSTWYRNATGVSGLTNWAVPAMLTGRYQYVDPKEKIPRLNILDVQKQIRSMPKPVSVKVTMAPAGDGSIRFAGESSIDMTAWGLKPPKALLGAIGTKKEMLLRFEVEAKR